MAARDLIWSRAVRTVAFRNRRGRARRRFWGWRSTQRGYTPNRVGEVVGDDQRTARVHGDANGPAPRLPALGLGVVFSIGGGSLTSLLTAPRLTFALSRDGSLPAWFGNVNEKSGAPVNSILFCGLFSIAMAIGQHFGWLATLSTFVRLLTYALCIASLPIIERTVPAEKDQFRLPGGLVIPAVGFLLTIWLIGHSTADNFQIAGAIIAVGTAVFWLCTRRSTNAGLRDYRAE